LALVDPILYRQEVRRRKSMSTDERRAPGAARIPFDGLVEVGGTLGPSFEAQAVDVSEEGMHVRTAYLPELGQQVTCRFEAGRAQSVVASGEVVWSRGADRGGEFGIRFTEVEPESIAALKGLCGLDVPAGAAPPGSKVRLYIEGLAAPMRAKIRETRKSAVTVGSDLGFLRVGKQLQLEDAQSGNKRPASIDRVDVAIDPGSQVPQLVVTLRYSDLDGAAATNGSTAAGAVSSRDEATSPSRSRLRESRASSEADSLEEASSRMKGVFARQAARVQPALEDLARRAKTMIALLGSRRRRGDDDSSPRRTTAPAPGGGLHTSGRRVVRGESGGPASPTPSEEARPKAAQSTRRKAAVAAAVTIAAVLGAVALKKGHPASEPSTVPTPVTSEMTPPTAGSVAANTPSPAASSPAASAAALGNGPTGPTTDAGATGTPSSGGSALAAADNASNDPHGTGHARPRPVSFGNGPVHHGVVLQLRMDGPVESIEGAPQPTGFVVKMPGRKSLEAAAPLAARDSRIASIRVNNASSGAELTLAFKDGVPNYHVSAHGDRLLVTISAAPMDRNGAPERTVAKRPERSDEASKHAKHVRETAATPAHHRTDTRPER
jgi:hypothetical protein